MLALVTDETVHNVTTVPIFGRAGDPPRFRGECSCGVRSLTFPAAGMVSGWEADHRENDK